METASAFLGVKVPLHWAPRAAIKFPSSSRITLPKPIVAACLLIAASTFILSIPICGLVHFWFGIGGAWLENTCSFVASLHSREKDDRCIYHPSGLPLAMVVPSSLGPDFPLTWAYNKRGKEKVFEGEKEVLSKKLKQSVSPDHAFHHRRLAIEGGLANFLAGQDQLFLSPIRRYIKLVDQPS
nr:hypothetical protein Iba_chr11aCG13740 [Ipomoea batatas]